MASPSQYLKILLTLQEEQAKAQPDETLVESLVHWLDRNKPPLWQSHALFAYSATR